MVVPQITAIIATYQRPQFLKRSLNSVLSQSYPHFQVIVADNASGGETRKVMEEALKKDRRIQWIERSVNIGMRANFQEALGQTTTPYLCFLPDDDFYGPDFFAETLPYFEMYPDIVCCGGGGVNIDQEYEISSIEKSGQTIPPEGYYLPPYGFFTYIRSSFGIAFPSLVFKTDVIKKLGGFHPQIKIGIDEDLISQCASRFPIYLLTDKPHYFGFQHPGSLSRQIDFEGYESDCLHLQHHLYRDLFSPQEYAEAAYFFSQRHLKILSSAYQYYYKRREFYRAHFFAKKAAQLTGKPRWKKKSFLASLYRFAPFFSLVFDGLAWLEKRVRCVCKGRKREIKNPNPHPLSIDRHKWKNYAKALETDLIPIRRNNFVK